MDIQREVVRCRSGIENEAGCLGQLPYLTQKDWVNAPV